MAHVVNINSAGILEVKFKCMKFLFCLKTKNMKYTSEVS